MEERWSSTVNDGRAVACSWLLVGPVALAFASSAACYGGSNPRSADDDEPPRRTVNDGGETPPPPSAEDDDEDPPPPEEPPAVDPLTAEQVEFYLRKLAPAVAGRSLSFDEVENVGRDGPDAIAPMLASWVAEPGFGNAMRDMMETLLAVSGSREGIDFELPGNLVAQVAAEDLPWSTIVTADYCVDDVGSHGECDTGAPYEAGVLATRAFLISNKGRFNLSRANRMLAVFACQIYPMSVQVQPPLQRDLLIPMFQADVPDEQTVDEAAGGFGNGFACYTCHSQFGAHAQLFVKYDGDGLWQADATGQQNPDDELGRSLDGLYTSHFDDETQSANEATQFFGEDVSTMRDAAEVLSDHPLFYSCTAKNLVATAFGLESAASEEIEDDLVEGLADEILSDSPDPTIAEIVQAVFTDVSVIRAVVAQMEVGS